MGRNLLKDGGFEADWGTENSHRCKVFPKGREAYETDVGNIFTPPGWVTWFRHDPGTWDQPEVRDAWKPADPHRVHSGEKGMLLFTFFRKHDAGFLQRVSVSPGARLRLTAWAHGWSNHDLDEYEWCNDDGRCSYGVGKEAAYILEGEAPEPNGDPWNDAIPNITFYLGIDPSGGTDPFADTVAWGQGAHIYNEYAQPPAVEVTTRADTVTVFLRSKTLWPFKHNDAYWDDAELVVVGEEVKPELELSHRPARPKVGETVTIEARSSAELADVRLIVRQLSGTEMARGRIVAGRDGDWYTWTYTTPPLREPGMHRVTLSAAGDVETSDTFMCAPVKKPQRGLPRVQYERTYVLLPSDADEAWALAVVDAGWDEHRYTIGSSADDAGIGDLDVRRVVAVNPARWPNDLSAFFKEYYPGVKYIPVEAANPRELRDMLQSL